MAAKVEQNLGAKPGALLADSGYWSEEAVTGECWEGINLLVSPDRDSPDKPLKKNSPRSETAAPGSAPSSGSEPGRATVSIAQADGGAGVWTDQTGAGIPPVFPARPGKSERGMEADLHRPQPVEDLPGRRNASSGSERGRVGAQQSPPRRLRKAPEADSATSGARGTDQGRSWRDSGPNWALDHAGS